jgi:ATP/maltotriose-dependent transcriptional regulator MalT
VQFIRNVHATIQYNAFLARVRLIQGADLPEVFQPIATIENLEHACPGARSFAAALRIQCLISRGWNNPHHLAAARRLADGANLTLNSPPRDYAYPFSKLWHQMEKLTAARLIIAKEYVTPGHQSRSRLAEVIRFLESFLGEVRKKGLGEMELSALILLALAHHAAGSGDRACRTLSKAFAMAEPEGYTRAFIDEGKPMAELLRTAMASGLQSPLAGPVLPSIEGELKRKHLSTLPGGMPVPPVEALSRQEVAILRLIAQGLSNQEIADKLCVALTTVKTHNYNIFSKLGVNRRYQAVRKAQETGLI